MEKKMETFVMGYIGYRTWFFYGGLIIINNMPKAIFYLFGRNYKL